MYSLVGKHLQRNHLRNERKMTRSFSPMNSVLFLLLSVLHLSECGRTLFEKTGSFGSSPLTINSSLSGAHNVWRIIAHRGERIALNITSFGMFKGDYCQNDYLDVRDGYWHNSPLLGRFCGSEQIAVPVISTGNRMLVTFVTSSHESDRLGFTANYTTICGGELNINSTSVYLQSPNYPGDYPSNEECVWELSVPQNHQVGLNFHTFNLENTKTCENDYVEVRDGQYSSSRLIGVFCGYQAPPYIVSSGSKLRVKFVSNGSVQKAGFSALLVNVVDECALNAHSCEHNCIKTPGGYKCSCRIGYELHSNGKQCKVCGGRLTAMKSVKDFYSHAKYGNANYENNIACDWIIEAPIGKLVRLSFRNFQLEACRNDTWGDFVKVFSGSDDSYPTYGMFCGDTIPMDIVSMSNTLVVKFHTDHSQVYKGFSATYLAVQP